MKACYNITIFLCFALGNSFAFLIPTHKIDFSSYTEDLGFTVNAMIHEKSNDGLINYHVALTVPYNTFFGVTAAIVRGDQVAARFSITGVEFPAKNEDDKKMIFEFDCAPEEIKDVVVTFQIQPPEGEVAFIQVNLSSWPVMIVADGALKATVPLSDVSSMLLKNQKK
jgi:hypothetical protein